MVGKKRNGIFLDVKSYLFLFLFIISFDNGFALSTPAVFLSQFYLLAVELAVENTTYIGCPES